MWSIQRHCGGIVLLHTHNLQTEWQVNFTISAQRHKGGIVFEQLQLSQHAVVVISLVLGRTWVLAVNSNKKNNKATFNNILLNFIVLCLCSYSDGNMWLFIYVWILRNGRDLFFILFHRLSSKITLLSCPYVEQDLAEYYLVFDDTSLCFIG